jgi:hypothetical protein
MKVCFSRFSPGFLAWHGGSSDNGQRVPFSDGRFPFPLLKNEGGIKERGQKQILRQERDILKKTVSIFAQPHP